MKEFIIGLVSMLTVISCKAQENMKVVYVYDALCGWCYGFSPAMNQFQEKYKSSLDVEVISGGMVTGERVGPIGEVAGYISWAYKDVEQATGIKFGKGFLDGILKDGTAIFTSVPSAIALSVFKELQPSNSLAFAAALQKAVYFDGLEPKNYDGYGKIAANFGLEAEEFVMKMNDDTYLKQAEGDFSKSKALGVTGFPTVFIEVNDTYYKIASGYIPFEKLEKNFLSVKQQMK
ncbi:MAG: DsbA family protein [Bacteroidota bacterium]